MILICNPRTMELRNKLLSSVVITCKHNLKFARMKRVETALSMTDSCPTHIWKYAAVRKDLAYLIRQKDIAKARLGPFWCYAQLLDDEAGAAFAASL